MIFLFDAHIARRDSIGGYTEHQCGLVGGTTYKDAAGILEGIYGPDKVEDLRLEAWSDVISPAELEDVAASLEKPAKEVVWN